MSSATGFIAPVSVHRSWIGGNPTGMARHMGAEPGTGGVGVCMGLAHCAVLHQSGPVTGVHSRPLSSVQSGPASSKGAGFVIEIMVIQALANRQRRWQRRAAVPDRHSRHAPGEPAMPRAQK